MDKAVILARGLGTRMRKDDSSAELSEEQSAMAKVGVKAMIPIGRPFLDYVISGLADAGYKQICLVIGPEHKTIREYYGGLDCRRVRIGFAVQAEALGTADAVAAAEEFAAGEDIAVVNSDNYYPVEALRGLRELEGSGLAAFEREAMIAGSNIEPQRILKFAVIETDSAGYMKRVIEKPSPEAVAQLAGPVCLSLNCWRFSAAIFEACRNIEPSARGELEITDAVQYAIDSLGERFKAVAVRAGVLDMSSRKDVAAVTERLADVEVRL